MRQYISIHCQVSLNRGEIFQSKEVFENKLANIGRKLQSYHTDNAPFQSRAFQESLLSNNQTITFLGVGSHHQNGVSERAIKIAIWLTRTMMIHTIIMWLEQVDPEIFPMAMNQAVFI